MSRTPRADVFAGLVLVALFAAVPVQGEQRAELLLSWGAPYGMTGSSEMLRRDCADSAATDTLYLSYRLDESADVFSGLTGILMFHAQFEDTLLAPWNTTQQKPGFLQVEFPADTGGAFPSAFASRGFGDWRYYAEPSRGIIRFIYAVPAMNAGPVESARTYCLARVILPRNVSRGACEQPLCVEWMESKFTFSVNNLDVSGSQVHASFSAVNSPAGVACGKYRSLAENRRAELEARRARRTPAGAD